MVSTVVIGAGPAGLTAAYELTRLGYEPTVFEQEQFVGGLSRTGNYKGWRFDIGGHRFFTKVDQIQELWKEVLGSEFLVRPRLSRIYYRGRFFDYPLRAWNALTGLGPAEVVRILISYFRARMFPSAEERSFEQWVSNRFGRRLYEIFFKTYTEKVWGMPCSEISADWAAQRIKNLDLGKALSNALTTRHLRKGELVTTLIDQFHYPRLGPGMMWERMRDLLAEKGSDVVLGAEVVRLKHDGRRLVTVTLRMFDGTERNVESDHCISTMPLRTLVHRLDPPAPDPVLEAASRLRYRDFLTVILIVNRADVFPDNWIYVHSPEVRVGRIQNFKNWSPSMVPDPARTLLGLEYFVNEGDDLWTASDEELIALGVREVEELSLVSASEVEDGTVVRVLKAYPIYDPGYQDALTVIREHLEGLSNLQVVGRNGQHRYNNQDHSMLSGIYAARNIAGAAYDEWDVNVEREYHEEAAKKEDTKGDRLLPKPVAPVMVGAVVRKAFAQYEPVALGLAIGIVLGLGLFLATAVSLLRGTGEMGQMLSLLGCYLFGYEVSWGGACIGLVEASAGGFVFGYGLAVVFNLIVRLELRRLGRQISLERVLDPLEGNQA